MNAVALTLPEAQQAQCAISEVVASPSGALLAYTLDGSGYETYDILLKDLSSGGTALGDRLEATGGGIAWADERTLFYIRQDGAHRPFQVWRHRLGTRQDEDSLVYEDADELFNVHVSTSRECAAAADPASRPRQTIHRACTPAGHAMPVAQDRPCQARPSLRRWSAVPSASRAVQRRPDLHRVRVEGDDGGALHTDRPAHSAASPRA